MHQASSGNRFLLCVFAVICTKFFSIYDALPFNISASASQLAVYKKDDWYTEQANPWSPSMVIKTGFLKRTRFWMFVASPSSQFVTTRKISCNCIWTDSLFSPLQGIFMWSLPARQSRANHILCEEVKWYREVDAILQFQLKLKSNDANATLTEISKFDQQWEVEAVENVCPQGEIADRSFSAPYPCSNQIINLPKFVQTNPVVVFQ